MVKDHRQASRHARSLNKAWWLVPLVLAVVIVIAWLWVLPWYIEKRLVEKFSSMTGRDVTIEDVTFNPSNAGLTFDGVRLAGEAQTPVFSSERIEAAIQWSSLWSTGWQLDRLDIQAPRLQLIWLNGGTLSGEGAMGFSPWLVDADLNIEQVPLETLSAYLAHVMRARVNAGLLAAQLRVQAGEASDAGTRVTGNGDIQGLDMLAPEAGQSLATADQLAIEGLVFESRQPRLQAEQVSLQRPWIEVVIDEQLDTNLTAWRSPEQSSGSSQANETSQDESSMHYALTTLAIEGGAVAFADRHLPQPFRIDLSALQGEWSNISSAQEGDGQLALQGEVSDGSSMRIEGAFDPLGSAMQGNLNLHFDGLELTTFAPYVREFGGYAVEQGQATLDLDYRLENGQLRTNNHVVLRRLELGEQVDESVTELPIRTFVGILQGDDDVIDLEIPMTLPLDDPSAIDFGSIAGQAIREALENLLSSPIEALSETLGNGSGGKRGDEGSQNGHGNNPGQAESPDAQNDGGQPNDDQRDDGSADIYDRARTPL